MIIAISINKSKITGVNVLNNCDENVINLTERVCSYIIYKILKHKSLCVHVHVCVLMCGGVLDAHIESVCQRAL